MKASVIAYGGILLILIITSVIALYIVGGAEQVRRNVVTVEGGLMSFENYADMLIKTFDVSVEFISQRAAYDLGNIGGIEGKTALWNSTYPSMDLLKQQLESRIKENLSKGETQDDRTVTWSGGFINISKYGTDCSPIASSCFIIDGNKSIFIYDKSIDSGISYNPYNFSQNISSNYFRFLNAGRAVMEDSNFNTKFNDIGALLNSLIVAEAAGDQRFVNLDFSANQISTDIFELVIEEKCLDSRCLAPLNPGEIGELSGIPYDYLRLKFRINANIGSTPIPIIITENFNGGNDNGWTRVKGTWTVNNGVYQQNDVYSWPTNTLDYLSVFGDFNWQNYILEADARNIENDSVSLVFRYTQDLSVPLGGKFYRVILEPSHPLDPSTREAYIQYANGWDGAWVPHTTPGWEALNYTSLSYDPYSWKHLKVEVNGPNIKFWVNGNLILTASDSRLTRGKIGVLTNAKSQFDNVQIILIS